MPAERVAEFFDRKRPWSQYKDRVLDYYLVPYLQKVKKLKRPIVVFDMFAGRGVFKTGEPGSPLIIAKRLEPLHRANVPVQLVCIEDLEAHFHVLQRELSKFPFASADTAFVVPLTVTVANGTALPSGFVTFPVIVLLCAIMIMAGKQTSTSSKIFFMGVRYSHPPSDPPP